MTTRRPGLVPLAFAAASLAVLPGCEPGPAGSTVTIRYSQLGVCNGYQAGSGLTSKRPNSAFVVFEIESLDGTKSGVEFGFVPSRLFVDLQPNRETWGSSLSAGRYFVSTDRRFTDPLGVDPIKAVRVPPRGTTNIDRLAFVAVPTTEENGASEAGRTSYRLHYDGETGKESGNPPDPHIEFVKTNEAQASWKPIDECADLKASTSK